MNKNGIFKKTFIIGSLSLFAFFTYRALLVNETIKLGKRTFCIPKIYDTLDMTSGASFRIKGADTGYYGGTFQSAIPSSAVKKSIPDYALFHGDLSALLMINLRTAPKGEHNRTLSNQLYQDTLQLKNKYQKAQVQYAEEFGFYRVSQWEQFPPPFAFWKVLKIKPDKSAILPEKLDDYYVATCINAGGTTGINGTSTICDYSLEIDGFLVKISTTENNLHLKDKIAVFAKNLLATWEENCD